MPSIRVVIRFRPLNSREKALNDKLEEPMTDEEMVPFEISDDAFGLDTWTEWPRDKLHKHEFNFDYVAMKISQDNAFENIGLPIVEDFVRGVNGTIFAYGQSGSGKSYTMFGKEPDMYAIDEATGKRVPLPIDQIQMPPPEEQGLIPRCTTFMFGWLQKNRANIKDFKVKISFYEIYIQGQVRDLLDEGALLDIREFSNGVQLLKKGKKARDIREDKEGSMVTRREIKDIRGMLKYFVIAQKYRTVKATKLNPFSSRGHCIMRLYLEVTQKDQQRYASMFNFADLAGSEKVSKSQATGDLLVEAKYINQSLTTLGQVISALARGGKKGPKPPFRDSALSHCLKDSLVGNTKTSVVIAASPHVNNVLETLSSLKFAKRCKAIKTKAKRNVNLTAKQMRALIEKQKAEIERLKQLVGKGVGPQKPFGPAIVFTMDGPNLQKEEEINQLKKQAKKFFMDFAEANELNSKIDCPVKINVESEDDCWKLGIYFTQDNKAEADMMDLLDLRDQIFQYSERIQKAENSMFKGEPSKEDPLDPTLMARWRAENMELREEKEDIENRLSDTTHELHIAEDKITELASNLETVREQQDQFLTVKRRSIRLQTPQKNMDEYVDLETDDIKVISATVETFLEKLQQSIVPNSVDASSMLLQKSVDLISNLLEKTEQFAADNKELEDTLSLTKENYSKLHADKQFYQEKLSEVKTENNLEAFLGNESRRNNDMNFFSSVTGAKVRDTAAFWKKLAKKGEEASFRQLVYDTAETIENLEKTTAKYLDRNLDRKQGMTVMLDAGEEDELNELMSMTAKDVGRWIREFRGGKFEKFAPRFVGKTGSDIATITSDELKAMGMSNEESLEIFQEVQRLLETHLEDFEVDPLEELEDTYLEVDSNKFKKFLDEFRAPELSLLQQIKHLDPADIFDENDYVTFKTVFKNLDHHLNDKMLVCKIFSLLDERQSGIVSTTLLIEFFKAVKEYSLENRIMTDVSPYSNYSRILLAESNKGRLSHEGAKQIVAEIRGCTAKDIRENDLGVVYLEDLDEDQLRQLLENCPEAAWKTLSEFHPFERLIRQIEASISPKEASRNQCDFASFVKSFQEAGIEEITEDVLRVALTTVGVDYSQPFNYNVVFNLLGDDLSDVDAIKKVMDRTSIPTKSRDRIVPAEVWLKNRDLIMQQRRVDKRKEKIQQGVKELVKEKSRKKLEAAHMSALDRAQKEFDKALMNTQSEQHKMTQEWENEEEFLKQRMKQLLEEKAEMASQLEEEIRTLKEQNEKQKSKLKVLGEKAKDRSMKFHDAENALAGKDLELARLQKMYEEQMGVSAEERERREKEIKEKEEEILRLKAEKENELSKLQSDKEAELKKLQEQKKAEFEKMSQQEKNKFNEFLAQKERELNDVLDKQKANEEAMQLKLSDVLSEKQQMLIRVEKEKEELESHKNEILKQSEEELKKKREEIERKDRERNKLLAEADYAYARELQAKFNDEIRKSQRREREDQEIARREMAKQRMQLHSQRNHRRVQSRANRQSSRARPNPAHHRGVSAMSSTVGPRGTMRKKVASDLNVGEQVKLQSNGKGVVKFIGHIEQHGLMVGIDLFMGQGNCDGKFDGTRYFRTKTNMGIFLPPSEISHVYRVNHAGQKEKIRFQTSGGGAARGTRPRQGQQHRIIELPPVGEGQHQNFGEEDMRYMQNSMQGLQSVVSSPNPMRVELEL